MNVKPVCVCVAATTNKQKTKSFLTNFRILLILSHVCEIQRFTGMIKYSKNQKICQKNLCFLFFCIDNIF